MQKCKCNFFTPHDMKELRAYYKVYMDEIQLEFGVLGF